MKMFFQFGITCDVLFFQLYNILLFLFLVTLGNKTLRKEVIKLIKPDQKIYIYTTEFLSIPLIALFLTLQSHTYELYHNKRLKSTIYPVLINFSRMIWWRTRHSPGTPTERSISQSLPLFREQKQADRKADGCGSERSICLDATASLQMSFPLGHW